MRSLFFILTVFLTLLFSSCNKGFQGEPEPNKPPETFTIVDTIARFGENRFKSLITVNWWGYRPRWLCYRI